MTPALLAILIQQAPTIVGAIIALAKHAGLNDEANALALVLQRSDANADQLIANAKAALGI